VVVVVVEVVHDVDCTHFDRKPNDGSQRLRDHSCIPRLRVAVPRDTLPGMRFRLELTAGDEAQGFTCACLSKNIGWRILAGAEHPKKKRRYGSGRGIGGRREHLGKVVSLQAYNTLLYGSGDLHTGKDKGRSHDGPR